MININFDQDQKIIYAEIHGKVSLNDISKNVHLIVSEILLKHNYINGVLADGSDFDGWEDFDAFTEHINFVRDNHKQIKRETEVKCFEPGQKDKASEWLNRK